MLRGLARLLLFRLLPRRLAPVLMVIDLVRIVRAIRRRRRPTPAAPRR